MNTLVIARNTMGDALRKRVLLVFLLIAVVMLFLSLMLAYFSAREQLVTFKSVALPVDATPEWSGAPMGLDYIAGLAVENGADGGLFLAANADGQGVVARCEKTGC